ncbi:hypothetical protein [Bacillus cereus group sp. BfR-BA-01523]|uniref:hypothetical protein n=1 Tax=Bacillus cereus group sp. BfR-BA-01523 TaxID=2920371 RepID=UPI001F59B7B7|nr:hypothetical protein [Bacillus cereus group sp. BfR-BA-01523]
MRNLPFFSDTPLLSYYIILISFFKEENPYNQTILITFSSTNGEEKLPGAKRAPFVYFNKMRIL